MRPNAAPPGALCPPVSSNHVVRYRDMSQHFLQSRFREKLIEHLFIAELLRHSWHRRECSLEIARPEVENRGCKVSKGGGRGPCARWKEMVP